MAITFKDAPYVLLPGAAGKPAAGVQDSITVLQPLLTGGVIDKYESPAELIKTRQQVFDANIQFLKNITSTKSYEGFVDKPLINSYVEYAQANFNAKSFIVPAEVYGKAMTYNDATGGFKPIETPVSNVVAPLTQNYVPVVNTPTYTVTYLDSNVTATEGQDLVLRFKLDTKNHDGVTFRNSFSNLGNQFLQSDVVGAESRSNYIFPEIKFAAGSDYTEMRLGTVDDTSKELDEAVKAFGGSTTSNAYKLNFVGETLVTLQDNDWGATVNNITNVSIVGNNNTVNVLNNYGTIFWENKTFYDVKGDFNANTLVGTSSADKMSGFEGNDNLSGGEGDDVLLGNQGNDELKGGYGTDVLWGGFGDDIILGNQGNDTLRGNDGADVLWGGFGDDILIGNQGNDILYGNDGKDTFIMGSGIDVIKDFAIGEVDKIEIYGSQAYTLGQSGNNLEIIRGQDKLILENVNISQFDATRNIQVL